MPITQRDGATSRARRVLGISRGDMAKYRNGTAASAGGFTFERVHLSHAINDLYY